jgi:phosphoglycolate phosphatase
MYASRDRLVIFDADGTLIDAFHAVEQAFCGTAWISEILDRFQQVGASC